MPKIEAQIGKKLKQATLHGTNTKHSQEAKSRGIKIIPSWAPAASANPQCAVQLLLRPVLQADAPPA